MQRIVVGVDGSAASKAALRWPAEMAGRLGAHLEVIRAWHYPPPYHEWDARPSSYGFLPLLPDRDRAERLARDELTATTGEVLGAHPTVKFDERVINGHATDVLIEASTDAALLVVGQHGHDRLQAFLLGSVARACTEQARCPVVVIPAVAGEPKRLIQGGLLLIPAGVANRTTDRISKEWSSDTLSSKDGPPRVSYYRLQ